MVCSTCGADFPDDASFCPNCGAPLGQPAERKRCAAVGIESHLVKPVDLETVMEAIGASRVSSRSKPSA